MRVASLRLRFLAALVDAAIVVGGVAGVGGIGIAGVIVYARVRGDKDEQDGDEQDEPSAIQCMTREFRQSPELSAALSGASASLAVASRNWRGPGLRVVGLRRVEARTGGIVSVRSALIGVLFDQACQTATTALFRSRAQRQRDRVSALGPQLWAVERKYADDPGARRRAVMEFYKANDVNPLAGWGWLLAGPVVPQLALAVGSRGGRTVRDRITSTSVIVDR
jgi:hypothetical protein